MWTISFVMQSIFLLSTNSPKRKEINNILTQIDKNLIIPKEIIEIFILHVPHDILLLFSCVSKHFNDLIYQTKFKELRYKVNPLARDSVTHTSTIQLIEK